MSEMLMLYRGALANLLDHFQVTTMDAGQVFNRELGRDWTKPGEFMQYHLENGPLHIWIMRCATVGEARYHVAFGADPGYALGDPLTMDELKSAVVKYLYGGG